MTASCISYFELLFKCLLHVIQFLGRRARLTRINFEVYFTSSCSFHLSISHDLSKCLFLCCFPHPDSKPMGNPEKEDPTKRNDALSRTLPYPGFSDFPLEEFKPIGLPYARRRASASGQALTARHEPLAKARGRVPRTIQPLLAAEVYKYVNVLLKAVTKTNNQTGPCHRCHLPGDSSILREVLFVTTSLWRPWALDLPEPAPQTALRWVHHPPLGFMSKEEGTSYMVFSVPHAAGRMRHPVLPPRRPKTGYSWGSGPVALLQQKEPR